MILVLSGTQKQNFSRMLDAVAQLETDEDIVVQAGHTPFSHEKMTVFDFLPSEELEILSNKATYIITHAGAGSMLGAIKNKKLVLAVPRLAKYNEHVDNHQLQLATKLEQLGYLLVMKDGDDMGVLFEQLKTFTPKPYTLTGEIPQMVANNLKSWGI